MGSSLCTITFLPSFLYFHCSVIINKVLGYRNVKGKNSVCAPNPLLKGQCHEIYSTSTFLLKIFCIKEKIFDLQSSKFAYQHM